MFEFADQVVMVTGAAGNLGAAVARGFHEAGASLVLVDYRADRLDETWAGDPRAFVAVADLQDHQSVSAMVEQALARYERLDAVANTVGGYRAGTPVHETPLETWEFVHGLNARSAFILSQAVVPPMLARQQGRIVHVAARAGLAGTRHHAAYSASKSAVIRLTESLAAELKHNGINVNCVMPGTIDTPQNREDSPDADFGRWVEPEAIADVILFLCSEAARAIHGAAVPVYGRS